MNNNNERYEILSGCTQTLYEVVFTNNVGLYRSCQVTVVVATINLFVRCINSQYKANIYWAKNTYDNSNTPLGGIHKLFGNRHFHFNNSYTQTLHEMVFINNEGQKIFLFFLFLDSTSKYESFAHFCHI
jgi:hypothetical protein